MTEPNRGRVTIPTDMDVVPETLKILDYWGADAIREDVYKRQAQGLLAGIVQVVCHQNLIAGFHQLDAGVAADITGAAAYQN